MLKPFLFACLILLSLSITPKGYASSITSIGVLPGYTSTYAGLMNSDGSVIFGSVSDANNFAQAYRWTQSGGIIGMGVLPGYVSSYVVGINTNGSVAAGVNIDANYTSNQAFRWTESSGMVGLGSLPGYINSNVSGMTADGSVIAGTVSDASYNQQAYRWTQTGGMVGLGYLPGDVRSYVDLMSADGTVILGSSSDANSNQQAYRWTQTGGMVGLGILPGYTGSTVNFITSDASVVVGVNFDANRNLEAYRWTQAGGMVGLGVLPGYSSSYLSAMNPDGSVIVGLSTDSAFANYQGYRWSQGNGMVGMGVLSGYTNSNATLVSNDGSIVVGDSTDASYNQQTYRWTQSSGMVGLGFLPGKTSSSTNVMTSDGSVLAGSSWDTNNNYQAFRWTQSTGIQSVSSLLTAQGVDLSTWNLTSVSLLNNNGSIIVGNGINNGVNTVYIANLSSGGLTTPQNLGQSLNTVAVSGQSAAMVTTQFLPQTLFAAQNLNSLTVPAQSFSNVSNNGLQNISPAAGGGIVRNRLSALMMGSVAVGQNNTSGNYQLNGLVGANGEVTPETNIAIGMIGSHNKSDLDFDGTARLNAVGGMVMASYQPSDTPLRVYGTFFAASLSVDNTRGYMNGSALDYSSGKTDGMAYGSAMRLGWENAIPNLNKTTAMPYVEGRYSKTKLDAYTEQGGAFASSFGNQDYTNTSSRLGVEFKHQISEKMDLLFRPAWGHRYSGQGNGFTASTGGLTQTLNGQPGDRDWAEASIGGTYRPTEKLSFSTELTGRSGETSEPVASVMVGAMVRF